MDMRPTLGSAGAGIVEGGGEVGAGRSRCDTGRVRDPADPAAGLPPVPWTLHAAFGLVLVESVAEGAFVVAREDYGPGGKALVLMAFVAKVAFAHLARRFSAGAVLGLLVFELVGILVAIGADWALGLRLALVANVVAVYVLVLASLRAFPEPELPRP